MNIFDMAYCKYYHLKTKVFFWKLHCSFCIILSSFISRTAIGISFLYSDYQNDSGYLQNTLHCDALKISPVGKHFGILLALCSIEQTNLKLIDYEN